MEFLKRKYWPNYMAAILYAVGLLFFTKPISLIFPLIGALILIVYNRRLEAVLFVGVVAISLICPAVY